MKKGFPEIIGNPICGAKGTPAVCWNSTILSVCRTVGYQLGYLTWLFSRFRSGHCHGVSRAVSTLHFYPRCSFLCGGRGYPRIRQGFPACEARAQATKRSGGLSPSFLFHVFFTILFSFFRFFTFPSHSWFCLRHAGVLRFFGFFCSVFVVCDTPWFWLVFNVSELFCVDGSSITQCMIY